jgi:hypothetical protein
VRFANANTATENQWTMDFPRTFDHLQGSVVRNSISSTYDEGVKRVAVIQLIQITEIDVH